MKQQHSSPEVVERKRINKTEVSRMSTIALEKLDEDKPLELLDISVIQAN